jgi:hypothetical protein
MFYLTSALIGRILLRQPAWRWPLVFERPWISTSLADLWSFRWHQTFRYMFVELGSRPGGAKLASGRLGAFALSGAALHDFGMWGDSEREWSPACYRILSPHERRYRLGVSVLAGDWASCRWALGFNWVWSVVWSVGWDTMIIDACTRRGLMASDFFPFAPRPGKWLVDAIISL